MEERRRPEWRERTLARSECPTLKKRKREGAAEGGEGMVVQVPTSRGYRMKEGIS